MKSFLKTVLAVVVGLILTTVIGTIFVTCSMVGLMAVSANSSQSTVQTQPGDVLFLKINGTVSENAPALPFNFDAFGGFSLNETPSLQEIIRAIDVAEQDPNISGIYLNADGMSAAPATYEIIHDRLVEFRNSGKWVISYSDNISSVGQYYLASTADEVYLNVLGGISFDGLSSTIIYPKKMLDKLGIEMQVFRVGQFKSAVEPYMVEHISEANRLQTATYLRSIWDRMVSDIALSRPSVSVDSLNSLANQAVSYMLSEEIANTGLVDTLVYKRHVEDRLKELTGKDKVKGISIKQLAANHNLTFPQTTEEKVAILYAVGEISSSPQPTSGTESGIYYDALIKHIRNLEEDENVKAVVLRVNSPGGSVFASEQIKQALLDLQAAGKPLVVAMGNYAASGGYYISAYADYIFAMPNTITGSIGVYGQIPNFSGLATDKLGVNFEEVKTHNHGTLTNMRAADSFEKAKIQRSIERVYEDFTGLVAEGRNMTQDSVKVIAGGRVWTGTDALQIGLVDELGGITKAVQKAAELAGLQNYSVSNYPEPEDPFTMLMKMFGETTNDLTIHVASWLGKSSGTDIEVLRFIQHIMDEDHIQARSFDRVMM